MAAVGRPHLRTRLRFLSSRVVYYLPRLRNIMKLMPGISLSLDNSSRRRRQSPLPSNPSGLFSSVELPPTPNSPSSRAWPESNQRHRSFPGSAIRFASRESPSDILSRRLRMIHTGEITTSGDHDPTLLRLFLLLGCADPALEFIRPRWRRDLLDIHVFGRSLLRGHRRSSCNSHRTGRAPKGGGHLSYADTRTNLELSPLCLGHWVRYSSIAIRP